MKIIFSRKGFDSGFGGYPSPIFENGKIVSLPIPSNDSTKYSDLKIDGKQSYFNVMKQLNNRIRNNKKFSELTENTRCHLDPDICKEVVRREKNWLPIFGQINQAQSHLVNQSVGKNDLFLFFGWFRQTILKNCKLQFVRSKPHMHVIFGYLQIEEILQVNNNTEIPSWMRSHSHVKDEERKKNPTNTIYIARKNLTWNNNKAGAGTLRFNKKLVLTKDGFSRSKWDLPSFFKGLKISGHTDESWKKEGYFQSARIGQEFVVEENTEVENWAKDIINNY